MTPAEFRTIANDWPSVVALAADLGVTRQTVHQWLNGSRPIPETAAKLARILRQIPELRDSS